MVASKENKLIDKVIAREIYNLEQADKNDGHAMGNNPANDDNPFENDSEDEQIQMKGKKQDKRKNKKKDIRNSFSRWYNFYFDLTKRLKIRMKENRMNFKFRKASLPGNFETTDAKAKRVKSLKGKKGKVKRTLKRVHALADNGSPKHTNTAHEKLITTQKEQHKRAKSLNVGVETDSEGEATYKPSIQIELDEMRTRNAQHRSKSNSDRMSQSQHS